MFLDSTGITELDLSSFDTSNITSMDSLFSGTTGLRSLTLSGEFNTSKVTSMNQMFNKCGVEELDLSMLDTSKLTSTQYMFTGCTSLKNVNLSSFNTSLVKGMYGMFDGCTSLESVDLSSFNTSIVTDMRCLFRNCSSMEILDLSNISTAKVTQITSAFEGMTSLKKVIIGDSFSFKGSGSASGGLLPTPDNGTGLWYNTETQEGLAPADIPNNSAATYVVDLNVV